MFRKLATCGVATGQLASGLKPQASPFFHLVLFIFATSLVALYSLSQFTNFPPTIRRLVKMRRRTCATILQKQTTLLRTQTHTCAAIVFPRRTALTMKEDD